MKKNVLLRPPVLVVMVALLLAVSGVLYAHWTTSLSLDGNVNTGGVGVAWNDAWTNDDGINNGDNEPFAAVWGSGTSADPAVPGVSLDPADRYDKDVAGCFVEDVGGEHLGFSIHNGYPSYHCTITALLGAQGSVPVKATALSFTGTRAWGDEFGDYEEPLALWPGANEGNFAAGLVYGTAEIEGDFSAGVRCGTQLDPMNCQAVLLEGPDEGKFWHGPTSSDGDGNEYTDLDGNPVYCEGNDCWVNVDDFQPDGEYNPGEDFLLGQDCDYGQEVMTSGWLHILNAASQHATYNFHIDQSFVNWNEFWPGDCTPGAEVADANGNLYSPERFACPTVDEGYVLDFADCPPPTP